MSFCALGGSSESVLSQFQQVGLKNEQKQNCVKQNSTESKGLRLPGILKKVCLRSTKLLKTYYCQELIDIVPV